MTTKITPFCLSFSLLTALSATVHAQHSAISLSTGQSVTMTVSVIPTAGPVTVEAWVYVPSAGALDGLSHAFVYQGDAGLAFYLGYDGASGHITAGDLWDGGYVGATNTAMPFDQWVHLALTGDMSLGYAKLYVNGKAVDSIDAPFYSFQTTTPGTQIGQIWGNSINAEIDNLRIWELERSQTEIKKDMFQTTPAVTTGLLADYTMDENDAAILHNTGSLASTADGTMDGGVTRVPSPIVFATNAVTFNGTSSQVNIDPDPTDAFNLSTGGTIEGWIYPTTLDNSESTIAGLRGGGAINWSAHITNSAILIKNATTTQSVSAIVPLNTWTHLAFVYDGYGNTTIYENGTPLGVAAGLLYGSNGSLPLTFGISKTASTDADPFRGSIDEIRIWNTQRAMSDIITYRDKSLTGTETGLIGEWSFDQGVAGGDNTGMTTVPDMTTASNNATLSAFDLSGTVSNFVDHSSVVPLPVTLAWFNAAKDGAQVRLQWQTASEQHSHDFTIQRSPDGQHFTELGSVPAAGNSNLPINYSFSDPSPFNGKNYYRLLETDIDGKTSYSTVKLVLFANTGNLSWYSTGTHAAAVSLQKGSNEYYLVSDINGRVITQGRLNSGKTTLSGLSAGMYIVRVIDQNGQPADIKVPIY